WPHARPWRLARPEPTLRAIPDVERVAALQADAFAAATSDRVVRGEAPAGDAGPAIAGLAPAAG
ncbi:MAG: PH domain-containing protein, partial [Hyphomicrobiales bacterium]